MSGTGPFPETDPEPRVSFITPAYDAAATLAETLRSAQAQSEARFELILVDDGSTDDTVEIARAFGAADPRVIVLEQENQGPSAARNRAVRRSRAPYLCFLDADDLISPEKIETQATILDERPDVGVVYSRMVEFYGDDPDVHTEVALETTGSAMATKLLRGDYLIGFAPAAALLRRTAFDAAGGFREVEPLVEDVDFWARVAFAGVRFEHDPSSLMYRRMQRGTRSTYVLDFNRGWCDTLRWLARRMDGIPPECRAELVRNARYRELLVAALYARFDDPAAARRWSARSLRWARRPGEVLESLRYVLLPRSAARLAEQLAGDGIGRALRPSAE